MCGIVCIVPKGAIQTFSGGLSYDGFTDSGLRKIYGAGDTEVRALDGIDLTVEGGEFVAVVGTSGSGKSTLLHMLGGLDRPTSGKVYVDGNDIFALKDDELTIFRRRRIGFVFQGVQPCARAQRIRKQSCSPSSWTAAQWINPMWTRSSAPSGWRAKLSNLPSQLSGGQQQRVAIARALATKPAIILADEPTGNLDSRTSQDVLALMKVTSEKFGQTIVMITHNEEIAQLAHRIVRIEDGRIVHS